MPSSQRQRSTPAPTATAIRLNGAVAIDARAGSWRFAFTFGPVFTAYEPRVAAEVIAEATGLDAAAILGAVVRAYGEATTEHHALDLVS
jgi:hypothetical protein